jgi:hypothetical protein
MVALGEQVAVKEVVEVALMLGVTLGVEEGETVSVNMFVWELVGLMVTLGDKVTVKELVKVALVLGVTVGVEEGERLTVRVSELVAV